MTQPSKCKITVLKRNANLDLAQQFMQDASGFGPCDQFSDGQEFVVDIWYQLPEGFCPWAWADIRRDVKMIAVGGNLTWFKQPGTALAGCTDWFRPVIFKIERIED